MIRLKIRDITWSLIRADALIRDIKIPKPRYESTLNIYPPTEEGKIILITIDILSKTSEAFYFLETKFIEMVNSNQDLWVNFVSYNHTRRSGIFIKKKPERLKIEWR